VGRGKKKKKGRGKRRTRSFLFQPLYEHPFREESAKEPSTLPLPKEEKKGKKERGNRDTFFYP